MHDTDGRSRPASDDRVCHDSGEVGVKVAHVETGLGSFDRTMPEINRVLTDQI